MINPDDKLNLTREEVFGPVVNLIRVASAEEALSKANDTDFGLTASLWTTSLQKAMALTPRIQAGTVGQHPYADRPEHAVRRVQTVGQRP